MFCLTTNQVSLFARIRFCKNVIVGVYSRDWTHPQIFSFIMNPLGWMQSLREGFGNQTDRHGQVLNMLPHLKSILYTPSTPPYNRNVVITQSHFQFLYDSCWDSHWMGASNFCNSCILCSLVRTNKHMFGKIRKLDL